MKRISLAKRFRQFSRALLVLTSLVSFSAALNAQTPPVADPAPPVSPSPDPGKSTEALQARIGRARGLIAAHRLAIAASELESVRAATRDNAVRNITSIMLMSVYLEEGNYGRAEALLEESFQSPAAQKDEALGMYFALAGQAVNGARTHLARYRSFGINITDASLPAEAVSDLNRLRSLVERMIIQAKEISGERRAYDSLSLLEDLLGVRLSLAKDSDDQARWETEYARAREVLASSQTQIASLGGGPLLRPGQYPTKKISSPSPYAAKRTSESSLETKAPDKTEAGTEPVQQTPSAPVGSAPAKSESSASADDVKTPATAAKEGEPAVSDAGLLNAFAIRRVVPRYPTIAKQNGAAGLVRVYVIVEGGKVVAVSRSEGPALLRGAAEEAVRRWSFQVISIAGQPTRLSGYIDFNFTL